MKKNGTWTIRTTAIVLMTSVLLGGVVLAASTAGDKNDPLVSYSYFTETILPDLLADVEDEAEGVADDLRADFDDQIATYTTEMTTIVDEVLESQGGTVESSSAAYSVLKLAAGETLTLNAGDEVMLRIGTATVSGGTPALINTTAGTDLANGGSLVTNNLYLCTIDGRTLTAGGSEAWILVRQS